MRRPSPFCRPTSRAFPVAVLLALGFLASVGRADEALVVRRYDIGALTTALVHVPGDVLGLAPHPGAEAVALWPEQDEPEPFLDRDQLVELVKAGAQPTAWMDVEGAEIEARDDALHVRAPERVHAAVERVLADLWAEASRRITLEAHWIDLDASALEALGAPTAEALATGRLDAAGLAAVLAEVRASGSRSSSASSVVRPGTWACFGAADVVRYVADYDVEIAQGSRVGDPLVASAEDGWSVEARAFPLHGGSATWIEVLAQRAEIERPTRSLELEAEPFGSVDLPAARIVRIATAARVGPDGAWATLARSPERPDVLQVLLLTARTSGAGARAADPRRYDLGPLARAPMEFGIREPGPMDGGRAAPALVPLQEGAFASPDDWVARLRAEVEPRAWDQDGAWVSTSRAAIFAHSPAPVLDGVEEWLGRQEAAAIRTVRLRVDLLSSDDGEHWGPAGGVAFDLPLGRAAMFGVGVERSYVADWEVEVAQEIRSGDPIVGTAFGGLWMNVRATASPRPDAIVLNLQGALHDLAPTFAVRRLRNEETGVLETPRLGVVRENRDLVLEMGKPRVLESGGTSERRLRLQVRADR